MRYKCFPRTICSFLPALLIVLSLSLAAPPLASLADSDTQSEDAQDQGGQSLMGKNGDTFMEEVVTDAPKPKPKLIPIDLRRVGVSVDPHGNIVPLRDSPDDPWAASGVKPFYNHIETSTTLPYAYGLPYSPYGYGAGFPAFGYPRFGGYGYPGYGYPRFGGYGYPAFNPLPYGGLPFGGGYPYRGYPYGPVPPIGIGYATTGNSATFISNDLVTGAPLPQANTQTNVFNSNTSIGPGIGLVPGGGWITPSTNYQQNSIWKAFNPSF